MIVREKPSPWELLFVLRGSVITQILPQIAAVAGLSLMVVLLQRGDWIKFPTIAAMPLSIIGAALSIFAAFRNSASYDRWWEARKMSGLMVVEGRNLARGALSYISGAPRDETARRIAFRCVAMMQVTRDWLRDRPPSEESLYHLVPEERDAVRVSKRPPVHLLFFFSADIAAAVRSGQISAQLAHTLEERVSSLTLAFSCLERTKNTPMPFTYTLLIHRTAYLFCFLLPFGLADLSGYWTPLVAAIICYAFFGLDAIADQLEAPFADTPMIIPLDSVARALEINVLEMLGEKQLPSPIQPKDFIIT